MYLSANDPESGLGAVWDLGDTLLGRVDPEDGRETLAPGESYTSTFTAQLPPVLPDDYFIIVRTDVFDDVYEGNNNLNNQTTSGDAFAISVPVLRPDIPEQDELSTGEALLYRIDVPAGETLEVTLDSEDDGFFNELYIAYESLPSSINAQGRFESFLEGDQRAVIPRTEAGTYYVLVRNVDGLEADPATGERVESAVRTSPFSLTATFLPFSVRDVTPDAVGDDRYATITIRGAKFGDDASPKLVRPTFGEFLPVSFEVIDATWIIATFDLRNAPNGLYDVQVTNPDGSVAVDPHRLLIEPAAPLDVDIGIGGPNQLDFGELGIFGVTMTNEGNLDVPYAHLVFGVPQVPNPDPSLIPGIDVIERIENGEDGYDESLLQALVISSNLRGEPDVAGVDWSELDSNLNFGGILTTAGFAQDFVVGGTVARSLLVDVFPGMRKALELNPDFLDTFLPGELESMSFDMWVFAAATPMTADEYVTYRLDEAESLRVALLGDADFNAGGNLSVLEALKTLAADPGQWGALYLQSLADAGLLRAEDIPPAVKLRSDTDSIATSASAAMLAGPVGDAIIADGETKVTGLTLFFDKVREWLGHDPTIDQGPVPEFDDYNLGLSRPTNFVRFKIRVGEPKLVAPITPDDPDFDRFFDVEGATNDVVTLTGPSGLEAASIVPANTPLPYLIDIANPANADGAVQELRIVQALDPLLDTRSFRLGDLQLGSLEIDLPDDRASFTGEFDFFEDRGFVLQLTAGVDILSNTVTYLLTAVDPADGLRPTDRDIGFLLPGETAKMGYVIKLADEAATGDVVEASVRAFVNDGGAQDSNTVTNQVDGSAPVTTFTVDELGGGSYRVEWAAEDDALGTGVRDFTVLVSLSGGPFVTLQRRTTDTSLTFTAPGGRTAEFLVLAIDESGNIEEPPLGVVTPTINAAINLGALPSFTSTTRSDALPAADGVSGDPENALFIQALRGVVANSAALQEASFDAVLEPFTIGGFATGIEGSGARDRCPRHRLCSRRIGVRQRRSRPELDLGVRPAWWPRR